MHVVALFYFWQWFYNIYTDSQRGHAAITGASTQYEQQCLRAAAVLARHDGHQKRPPPHSERPQQLRFCPKRYGQWTRGFICIYLLCQNRAMAIYGASALIVDFLSCFPQICQFLCPSANFLIIGGPNMVSGSFTSGWSWPTGPI